MTDSDSALRQWRRRQEPRVSLADLADRLGTTKATLSRLETGEMEMTVPWARRINAETGIPMRDLLPALAAELAGAATQPAEAAR
jgi:transcriptional regulator with XRE-family HTH domain